jgi:hypothetical protein
MNPFFIWFARVRFFFLSVSVLKYEDCRAVEASYGRKAIESEKPWRKCWQDGGARGSQAQPACLQIRAE